MSPTAKVIGLVEWFRPGEHDRVERGIGHLRTLGVQHVRTGVSWADWAAPGGREWYDWLLPRLAAELTVLPCCHYTPPSLGVEPRTSAPPREPRAFAAFLHHILTHTGSSFDDVELWNEPNNLKDWDYRLDPGWTTFAAMIVGAAEVAQAAGKRVVLGGMCPIDASWLARMDELGVLDYVHAVGVHGFPGTWDFEWTDWRSNLLRAGEVLRRRGRDITLWITESAYSTWRHDERGQIEALLRAIDAPVERVYWSALQDLDPTLSHRDGFHVDERHYHLGLVGADDTPKLAYRLWAAGGLDALRDASSWLAPHRSRRARSLTVITGGAGFVGTNLAERLLRDDHHVLIYDNLSRVGVEQNLQGLCQRHPRVEVQVADVRDKYKVERAVRSAQHVFHFAAQVAVTTSLVQPTVDFDVNAGGTINVLEAVRARPTPPILIFTSTNKVYGDLRDLPLRETATRYEPADACARAHGISEQCALEFHSPYGCSKGTADQYVLDYARSYGVPAVVFRMSCIYGPHQCGNEDQGWVAHFVAHALTGQPLVIYGDGKQVRDVLYIDDLVDAFLLARENISQLAGEAFNMGGGPIHTTSLLELLARLEPIAGRQLDVRFEQWRTGDQRYYVSDTRRYTRATGWKATADVQSGVERLAHWLMTSGRLASVQAIAS
jgi:CDP-paratose 2-epimerase